jgi:hypothetical protein
MSPRSREGAATDGLIERAVPGPVWRSHPGAASAAGSVGVCQWAQPAACALTRRQKSRLGCSDEGPADAGCCAIQPRLYPLGTSATCHEGRLGGTYRGNSAPCNPRARLSGPNSGKIGVCTGRRELRPFKSRLRARKPQVGARDSGSEAPLGCWPAACQCEVRALCAFGRVPWSLPGRGAGIFTGLWVCH